MKNCKKIRDQIIFYEELTTADRQQLQEHLEICDECRQFFHKVDHIEAEIRRHREKQHIADELLTRYLLQDFHPGESDYDGKKMSKAQMASISSHLQTCDLCSLKLNKMKAEYQELASYVDELGLPEVNVGPLSLWDTLKQKLQSVSNFAGKLLEDIIHAPKPKLIPLAATVAVVLIILIVTPYFRTDGIDLRSLSHLEKVELTYLTRSSLSEFMADALEAFQNQQYEQAIHNLEIFLDKNPQHPNADYARYVLGLAYLFESQETAEHGDLQQTGLLADAGIRNLKNALETTRSERLKEEILWYLGKAYLLKEDTSNAADYFRQVMQMKGRKSQQAREIHQKLQKFLISQE
ncbi:MAG: hypothetical protein Kow0042_05120 [Calditrichia bacterium]